MQRLSFSKAFFLIFLFFGALSALSRAERPTASTAQNFILQGQSPGFSPSGAAYLPSTVLQAMKAGQLSPVMQFALVNQMMNKCIADVVQKYPARRDSYVTAKQKFDDGQCRIEKCYQQGVLLMMLPQLSTVSGAGGAADAQLRQAAAASALQFANAFKRSKACGASGGADGGIDPAYFTLFGSR